MTTGIIPAGTTLTLTAVSNQMIVDLVVTDGSYGTIDNYRDVGFPHRAKTQRYSGFTHGQKFVISCQTGSLTYSESDGQATSVGGVQPGPDGNVDSDPNPTAFLYGDSLTKMLYDSPTSTFNATIDKGTFTNGSLVIVNGIMNVYAENPCRIVFRAAPSLLAGDEIYTAIPQSNCPISKERFIYTPIDATSGTINYDGTNLVPFVSAAAASDGYAWVDGCFSNYCHMSWAFHDLARQGYKFASIVDKAIQGRTTRQMADNIVADIAGQRFSHGFYLGSRNDANFDVDSAQRIESAMLAACNYMIVSGPFPDSNWTSPTNDAAAAKIAAANKYWQARQLANPRIRFADLYSALSDSALPLQRTRVEYLQTSDSTHWTADGALVAGPIVAAAALPTLNRYQRSVSVIGQPDNAMLNGRLAGVAGTVASGVSGSVATSWTVGQKSTNVTAAYTQPVRLPGRARKNSTAYVVGDTIDIGDGFLYTCKTAGTSASSQPSYTAAVLYDWATGVTDGTAVFFRIEKPPANTAWTYWQFIYMVASAGAGSRENLSFLQSIALSSTGINVGDRVYGACDLMISGVPRGFTMRTTVLNAGSTSRLAASHDLPINTEIANWPAQTFNYRRMESNPVRVPANAANIEWRFTGYFDVNAPLICFIANPGVFKQ